MAGFAAATGFIATTGFTALFVAGAAFAGVAAGLLLVLRATRRFAFAFA
jgi:hypothetical protein